MDFSTLPRTFEDLLSSSIPAKLVLSMLAITIVLVARVIVDRAVVRRVAKPNLRRRWRASVRTATTLILLLAVTAIWADALEGLAVSIVAVAVATVIATKDLIECIAGSLLRLTADAYTVGDRVAILEHRGDVVEYTVLTTTLREVDPSRASDHFTGQTVVLPNSLLLRNAVINESTHGAFVLHTFEVPIGRNEDWQTAERLLTASARDACADFVEDARRSWRQLAQAELDPSQVEARVTLRLPESEYLILTVTLVVPIGRQVQIEQVVIRRFLSQYRPPPA
jgi:small-conductance mechanosensitive channel